MKNTEGRGSLGQSVIIITEFNIFKTLYEEHRGKRFLNLGQSVIIITELYLTTHSTHFIYSYMVSHIW